MALTAAENLAAAKTRALGYLDAGDPLQAITSFIADLNKNVVTALLTTQSLLLQLQALLLGNRLADLRALITGTNLTVTCPNCQSVQYLLITYLNINPNKIICRTCGQTFDSQ